VAARAVETGASIAIAVEAPAPVQAFPATAPAVEPPPVVAAAPLGTPHLPAEVPHLDTPPVGVVALPAAEALAAAEAPAAPAETALAAEPIPAESIPAEPFPAEQPHLPAELAVTGPVLAGPAAAPAPDMTVSANLSTGTP